MNCQLCQKDLDAYREGKLPRDMKTQVESHLRTCETCSGIYQLQILADKVMDQEKELQSDQFLATRVMAGIENPEDYKYRGAALIRLLRPVLYTVSMAAAILSGIMFGNLSRPATNREKIPVELALINDAAIESVNILLNE
ncbi:MAG: zf-HC2 domain-containing protein [Bacteroidales bacterium]